MNATRSVSSTTPASPDLTLASVFGIDDLDHLDQLYNGERDGFIYARDGHPNARRLATRLAELDRAEGAVVLSSGMAAIAALALDRLRPGDRLLAATELYGKSLALFVDRLSAFGIHVELVDVTEPDAVRQALTSGPKLFWLECISNPLIRVARIDELAAHCRTSNVPMAVDATFTPPSMMRPLELGADFVMHSLTKILSGHSDVTLGSIAGTKPAMDSLQSTASVYGYHAAALDCWLAERGLATLELRYDRASANAEQLARMLAEHPRVQRVFFPGLQDHPDRTWLLEHARGFGYVLSFELQGGRSAVNRLFRSFNDVTFCPSLGDVRTTISHPATTSHRALDPVRRQQLGISDGLIRVSLGIESADAIMGDFDRALQAAFA